MVDPILLAEMTLPSNHPRAGEECPVFAFVIWHPKGPVLVDSGVGRGHDEIDTLYQPRHYPIEETLAERGLHRDDLVMVVNSHLHFDHCGNNPYFAGLPMVAQRTEYELARKERYTVPEWVDFPGARWELVDGGTDLLPGLRVLPTPGHTPGHQSVVIDTPDGVLVVAAQALYDPDEFQTGASIEPEPPDEAETTFGAARLIKSLEPKTVYFSHHPGTWPLDT